MKSSSGRLRSKFWPRRSRRVLTGLCLIGLVVVSVVACVQVSPGAAELEAREQAEQRLLAELQAATNAEVTDVRVPAPNAGHSVRVAVGSLLDGPQMLTADLVAVVAVVDTLRPETPEMVTANFSLDVFGSSQDRKASVSWRDPADGAKQSQGIQIEGFLAPYTDAFCALPELISLGGLTGASDFSRISECNPRLASLGVDEGWYESTGQQALADLDDLEGLGVGDVLTDPGGFPFLEDLMALRVRLEEDWTVNLAILQERVPNAEIRMMSASGSDIPWPFDS